MSYFLYTELKTFVKFYKGDLPNKNPLTSPEGFKREITNNRN